MSHTSITPIDQYSDADICERWLVKDPERAREMEADWRKTRGLDKPKVDRRRMTDQCRAEAEKIRAMREQARAIRQARATERAKKAPKGKGGIKEIKEGVGRRLRQLRVERGITQMQMAAALNVSYQQVFKYETGENRMQIDRLKLAAKLLGVSPSVLLDYDSGAELAANPRRMVMISPLIDALHPDDFAAIHAQIREMLHRRLTCPPAQG